MGEGVFDMVMDISFIIEVGDGLGEVADLGVVGECDVTVVWFDGGGDDVEKGSFADAVGADEGGALAEVKIERDVVEDASGAVEFTDLGDFQKHKRLNLVSFIIDGYICLL